MMQGTLVISARAFTPLLPPVTAQAGDEENRGCGIKRWPNLQCADGSGMELSTLPCLIMPGRHESLHREIREGGR